jgi:hypothetical protein
MFHTLIVVEEKWDILVKLKWQSCTMLSSTTTDIVTITIATVNAL